MKILREVGIPILIAIAVSVLLRLAVPTYVVEMSCMEPNIYDGELIVANRVIYHSSGPQRGDVIILDPPFESRRPFIKRVIGLPGETVEVKDGKVFIDGTALEEDEYIKERPNYTMTGREIPESEYFVLGDNRNNANDSHTGWTVPRDNIIGKAWFIYWPPSKWGVVKHYSYPELLGTEGQEIALCQSLGVQFE